MLNVLIIGINQNSLKLIEAFSFFDNVTCFIISKDKVSNGDELILRRQNINIEFMDYTKLIELNTYKFIIISNDIHDKYKIVDRIVTQNYSGNLIIDKPFACNSIYSNLLISRLSNSNFCIPYTNRVRINNFIKIGNINQVIINIALKNEVVNGIPHIFEIIIDQLGFSNNVYITKLNGNLQLSYSGTFFNIEYGTTQSPIVFLFNSIEVKYQGYITRYYEMINSMLTNKSSEKKFLIKKNKQIICLLDKYNRKK